MTVFLPAYIPSMKSYLAAALQMTSLPDVEKNLDQAEELIDLAVRRGAELVGLPENFAYMGEEQDKIDRAQEISDRTEKFLRTMAQRYQVTLLGGGFPVPVGHGQVHNTALLIGPDGEELSRYEKVHLFDVDIPDGYKYQESNTVVPGRRLPKLYNSEPFGKIGLSVCYDVGFLNCIATSLKTGPRCCLCLRPSRPTPARTTGRC
jgi:deaminated glutathione amidase